MLINGVCSQIILCQNYYGNLTQYDYQNNSNVLIDTLHRNSILEGYKIENDSLVVFLKDNDSQISYKKFRFVSQIKNNIKDTSVCLCYNNQKNNYYVDSLNNKSCKIAIVRKINNYFIYKSLGNLLIIENNKSQFFSFNNLYPFTIKPEVASICDSRDSNKILYLVFKDNLFAKSRIVLYEINLQTGELIKLSKNKNIIYYAKYLDDNNIIISYLSEGTYAESAILNIKSKKSKPFVVNKIPIKRAFIVN